MLNNPISVALLKGPSTARTLSNPLYVPLNPFAKSEISWACSSTLFNFSLSISASSSSLRPLDISLNFAASIAPRKLPIASPMEDVPLFTNPWNPGILLSNEKAETTAAIMPTTPRIESKDAPTPLNPTAPAFLVRLLNANKTPLRPAAKAMILSVFTT